MGGHRAITYTTFPRQGVSLGRRVAVCFHYDTSKVTTGTIVRDDMEAPFVTIIRLDDERPPVLATECQYSLLHEDTPC